MQKLLLNLSVFWSAYGPWVSLSLIPTILTGLSMSPKTQKAASFLQKAFNIFKQAMSFVSVATFKDEVGTFQLPLKVSNLRKKKPGKGSKKVSGSIGVLLFCTITLTTQSAGCNWFRGKTVQDIKTVVIDCGIESVKANAAHLLPVIMTILTGNAPNWVEQISAFTKELGRDAVACAMQMSAIELQSRVSAGGAEGDGALSGLTKARSYASDAGWTYAEAK